MKKYIGLIIAPILIGMLPHKASAQLVMTGSYDVVMTGGSAANPTSLVLTNPAPAAITRTGTGWIISENEFNQVDWNIGTNTGNYTVPFGYSNAQYLPVTLDISTAGTGSGVVKFSTYHTVADNELGVTSLSGPQSDVANMNAFITPGSPSNADNSYNVVDRAYVIDANTGYSTKPAAGNITFSYISGTGNSEVASPNVLNQAHLMAERYNSGTNTWSDWFGYGCTDAIVGNVGAVQTGPVPAVDMYRSWALWDNLNPLPLKMVSTNNLCGGSSAGSATVTVYGGVSAYTYAWNPSGQTTANATGLSAGIYTVTVTDNHGCSSTMSVTITAPPVLIATATVTANATGCNSNGSATVTASGGTAAYTYSWTSGSTTTSATGLSAGGYTVTVTDHNGCTATSSVTITAPPVVAATATVTANATACSNIGSASASASGGTTPYTYTWTSGSTTTTATGLSAGNYTITVHDNNGCAGTASVTITAPAQLLANASVTANASGCASTGSATAAPGGGTSPYTYSWTSGSTIANATGLSAGNYTVTVTDNQGCSATGSVTITAPVQLAANASVTSNATGCASTGSATSAPSGGTSPYTYSWTSGSTIANATGLSAGNYTVTVTDNQGCSTTGSITITAPAQLAANASVTANATGCSSNGSATSAPSGGSSPYTYSWTSGSTTANATGLSAGNYTVTVTDNQGCNATAGITITAPMVVSLTASVTANATECASTGSASVTAGGGTSPYTYSWTGGSTNNTVSGLSAGNYTVTVTDNSGCSSTAGVTITAPAALSLVQGFTMNADSGGLCDGQAWVTASGGTSAYTYSWSPGGETTDTLKGQCNGNYCCTVTDANGCSTSACVTITAIEEVSNASSISIYPDPNNGNFTVSGVIRGQVIVVYDYLGQPIASVVADQPTIQFDISTKANGVYLVRIQNRDGSSVTAKKIVKTQ